MLRLTTTTPAPTLLGTTTPHRRHPGRRPPGWERDRRHPWSDGGSSAPPRRGRPASGTITCGADRTLLSPPPATLDFGGASGRIGRKWGCRRRPAAGVAPPAGRREVDHGTGTTENARLRRRRITKIGDDLRWIRPHRLRLRPGDRGPGGSVDLTFTPHHTRLSPSAPLQAPSTSASALVGPHPGDPDRWAAGVGPRSQLALPCFLLIPTDYPVAVPSAPSASRPPAATRKFRCNSTRGSRYECPPSSSWSARVDKPSPPRARPRPRRAPQRRRRMHPRLHHHPEEAELGAPQGRPRAPVQRHRGHRLHPR